MRTSLAALAILLPSISGALACDNYAEEMALAAARREAKLAQSAPPQAQSPSPQATEPNRPLDTAIAVEEASPRQPRG